MASLESIKLISIYKLIRAEPMKIWSRKEILSQVNISKLFQLDNYLFLLIKLDLIEEVPLPRYKLQLRENFVSSYSAVKKLNSDSKGYTLKVRDNVTLGKLKKIQEILQHV